MALQVLGVAGSMRGASFSTRVVRLVLDLAEGHGAQTRLLELRTAELPMFRPDAEDESEAVRWADARLPETHRARGRTFFGNPT
jgi:NAD(P)H-dependent FMN reductase